MVALSLDCNCFAGTHLYIEGDLFPFCVHERAYCLFWLWGGGGVFAPSLSAGASFCAVVAEALSLTATNANLIILVGMTFFLTGVTRAPFTSAVIILEMTDRHSIIFFLLPGSVLANVVAGFVSRHSFYDVLKENYIREITA